MTKIKRHCQDNIEVYHFVSRTKARDKIATMYDILIIYSSKGAPIEKTSEAMYIRKMHRPNIRIYISKSKSFEISFIFSEKMPNRLQINHSVYLK